MKRISTIPILIIQIHAGILAFESVATAKNPVPVVDSAVIFNTVDSLTRNHKTDLEKVKVIYKWIKENIVYDDAMFSRYLKRSKDFHATPVDSVMYLKKGICSDYAKLFKVMLTHVKIRCEVVEGYARQDDEDFFESAFNLRHAWNAVYLNDKWSFVDATWASIVYNATGSNEDHFFLMSPDKFIFSHFPEDKKWMLTTNEITFSQFTEQPIVKSNYFLFAKKDPPRKGLLTTDKAYIQLDNSIYELVINLRLSVELLDTKDKTVLPANIDVVTNNGGKKELKISIESKG